jgi:hypothetical protein
MPKILRGPTKRISDKSLIRFLFIALSFALQ